MSTRERFKQEAEELVLFTAKLLLHWFVLAVILGFVLVAAWAHKIFRSTFLELDGDQSISSVDHVIYTPHYAPMNNESPNADNKHALRGDVPARSRRFRRRARAQTKVSAHRN